MSKEKSWITPFKKQCFVTLGASLNMSSHGIVMGFTAILLPQLRKPESKIPINDASGSWIAAIVGFALIVGNFIVPSVMGNFGRRTANIVSIVPLISGWFCIVMANSITVLLIARFLQGVAMGMTSSLCPVLIGEYTSPKNRGAFLMTISLAIASGVLTVHTLGSFLNWSHVAIVCAFIAFIDLLIVIYSPESPSFLADQGRYEECREAFRWLRGDEEEDELTTMIETNVALREVKNKSESSESFVQSVRRNLTYFRLTIKKREFYKPIFIMIHLYILLQFCGANLLSAYIVDIFHNVVGPNVDVALQIIALSTQRLISNGCALLIIKRFKRRTMLFITISLNLIAYLTIAAYGHCRTQGLFPFDHPLIGIFLIHLHMFSIATGTIPLPFIIAGEIFPLQYRSLSSGISVLFLSTNLFLTIKTAPLLFATLGIQGAYIIYAAVILYCLVIIWRFLPETKDRTLQDIEEEFRGEPLSAEDFKTAQSIMSLKYAIRDRRCSSPAI